MSPFKARAAEDMGAMALMTPCEGSIQWAMNRGTLFHVDGVYKYGQLTTRAESPIEAAACVLYRCEDYCVWVPSGTILTVWNVYAGSIGGFQMKDPVRFVVRRGEVFPVDNCLCGRNPDSGYFEPCCEAHEQEYVEYLEAHR